MNDAHKPPLGDDPKADGLDDGFSTGAPEWANQANNQLDKFLLQYARTAFIVIVLVILVVVFHWVPNEVKIAFLNFFYLPVLAAGYLMGARRAILSSVLCVFIVVTYYIWVWYAAAAASGEVPAFLDLLYANQETMLQLAIWAGFLMIVGGAFGRVNEHVMSSYKYVQKLRKEIKHLKEKGKTEE